MARNVIIALLLRLTGTSSKKTGGHPVCIYFLKLQKKFGEKQLLVETLSIKVFICAYQFIETEIMEYIVND